MRTLTRIAIFTIVSLLGVAYAQERQIEINADLPAKRNLTTPDIKLGGRFWLPMGANFSLVGDLEFKDAINLFLVPTDQINATGEVWYFPTGKGAPEKAGTSLFLFGGATRAMFIGQPLDSTQGIAGVGFVHRRPSGLHIIPVFRFSSENFESDRATLGRVYSVKVHIHIPISKEWNLNVTPQYGQEETTLTAVDGTTGEVYTASVGFRGRPSLQFGISRKF